MFISSHGKICIHGRIILWRASSAVPLTPLPYPARLPADYTANDVLRPILGCYATYQEADAALRNAAEQTKHQLTAKTLEDTYIGFCESNYFHVLQATSQSAHRGAWRYLCKFAKGKIAELAKAEFP